MSGMSDSEGEEESWEEVLEKEPDSLPLCPFCPESLLATSDVILTHCDARHQISFTDVKNQLKLDFYGWIKLVNYIRKNSPAVSDIKGLGVKDFNNEEYLVPVLPDDPLLQIDWEEEEDGRGEEELELKERLIATEHQLSLTRAALENALSDLNRMKETMRELTSSASDSDVTMETSAEEHDSYYGNYAHHGIHEEMLKDEVRMESYELFITRNSEIFKDKVVLDIGCGTGILSLLAVQAGASHVIAIDQSAIIYRAVEIARENGAQDKITFIRGEVESVKLPVETIDVLISEWMGYFLLFESMLDTVLYARDKWLLNKKNVYPNRCNMSLVAMGDGYEYNNKINFWDDVRGFKMSCLKDEVLHEPTIKLVDEYCLISTSDVIKKIDITTVRPSDLDFTSNFTLTIKQNDTCYGLVGYFDIGFEVPSYRVYFSTSPQDTPTHWHQTIFFLREPIQVQTGDLLRGTISCCKNKDCSRSLDVKIEMKLVPLSKDSPIKTLPSHSYTLS